MTAIEIVREMFEKACEESTDVFSAVWALVCALRGPDGDDTVKRETTAVIRGALLSSALQEKTMYLCPIVSVPLNKGEALSVAYEEVCEKAGVHFAKHIAEALRVLGWRWKEDETGAL